VSKLTGNINLTVKKEIKSSMIRLSISKKKHIYLYCGVITTEVEIECELNGQTQILLCHFASSGLKVLMSKLEERKKMSSS